MAHGTNKVVVQRGMSSFSSMNDMSSPIDFTQRTMMSVHEMFYGIPWAKVNVSEDFEIYLNKKDEKEILDLLLSKQDHKQKEIRQNERRRSWESGQEMSDIKIEPAKALLRVV